MTQTATPEPPSGTDRSWHSRTVTEIAEQLKSPEGGLSVAEAADRLVRLGRNELPAAAPPSALRVLLHQFTSPLIHILLGASVVALLLQEFTDAAFIAGVVVINAILGFVHEMRAERGIHALAAMVRTSARVRRGGTVIDVDGAEVVPGDRLLIESGLRVPADLRLVTTHALRIDESLLTGESIAVTKDAAAQLPERCPLGDRTNLAFAGAMVNSGRGEGIVVATGRSTQVGRIAGQVAAAGREPPPLIVRMEQFARTVGYLMLIVGLLIVVIGLLHGQPFTEVLLAAVALVVSAVPEGLPIALTVALAVAVSRMVQRGVVVRHLPAVEGLGSCTVIATDKTGTLTMNQLTVERLVVDDTHYEFEGAGYEPIGRVTRNGQPWQPEDGEGPFRLLRAAVLANEAELSRHQGEPSFTWSGDPTDVALLCAAHKAQHLPDTLRKEHPLLAMVPFESERRYAASMHRQGTDRLLCIKGAPEQVLALCRHVVTDDGRIATLTTADVETALEQLMAGGLRVIAVADRECQAGENLDPENPPRDMTFLGLVGMTDPPRPHVDEAIVACNRAGIDVAMITGDHAVTARAIGARIGLSKQDTPVLTGRELEDLTDAQLAERLTTVRVFARTSPKDKLRIVRVWQQRGAFVAVTGDGVNDAPALRQANLGVAMGKSGTDVAREAADLVLTDDDFTSIVAGVEEGRIAYDNVRKVTFLLISTGAAEVLLITSSVAIGLGTPLAAAQLLWLNLVTNGIQGVALVFEPGEPGVLDRQPRRPTEGVLNRIMVERVALSGLIMATIGLLCWQHWLTTEPDPAAARSKMVHLFVLFEILHIGNARSETISLFRLDPRRNPLLFYGSATALLLHLAATYMPMPSAILGLTPLTLGGWLELLLISLPVILLMELHKLWRRRTGMPRDAGH